MYDKLTLQDLYNSCLLDIFVKVSPEFILY